MCGCVLWSFFRSSVVQISAIIPHPLSTCRLYFSLHLTPRLKRQPARQANSNNRKPHEKGVTTATITTYILPISPGRHRHTFSGTRRGAAYHPLAHPGLAFVPRLNSLWTLLYRPVPHTGLFDSTPAASSFHLHPVLIIVRLQTSTFNPIRLVSHCPLNVRHVVLPQTADPQSSPLVSLLVQSIPPSCCYT